MNRPCVRVLSLLAGKLRPLGLVGIYVAMTVAGGCSEAVIRQYTRLGNWSRPTTDTPTVISGSPKADQAAYDASEQQLSQADWRILEKIAPRPIWERIDQARRDYLARVKHPTTRPAGEAGSGAEHPARAKVRIPLDIPATKLPDGRVRMVYALRYIGGAVATASYDSGTKRRKITRKNVDLGSIVSLVNSQLAGRGTCSPLPSRNTLVITCQAESKDMVTKLLSDIDQPAPQVEITARIFEIKHNFDFQLGARTILQHMAGDNKQSIAGTFSTPAFLDSLTKPGLGDFAFQGSTLRLLQIFGDSGLSIDATVQALVDTGLAKEVASPRMTVEVGQTGQMLAGQELPISSARIASETIVSETTTYKPVGVQLYVTPQTIGPDNVKLHVLTAVSQVAGFSPRMSMNDAEAAQAVVNPTFDTREAETHVTVADGDTLVIGGLRMVKETTLERKVPGLGDIKFLEWLFKNHRSQRELSDLYFFITPHIIHM